MLIPAVFVVPSDSVGRFYFDKVNITLFTQSVNGIAYSCVCCAPLRISKQEKTQTRWSGIFLGSQQ